MASFGDKLRYKRMGMGLSLKEASKKAKIKQKHLKALEEENLLIFSDKESIIELIKKYAPVVGIDQVELIDDFNVLWTDSRMAKAYLQQSFNKQKTYNLGLERIPVYGTIILAAALFLSVGGFLVWEYVIDFSPLGEERAHQTEAGPETLPEKEFMLGEDHTLKEEAKRDLSAKSDPGEKEYIEGSKQFAERTSEELAEENKEKAEKKEVEDDTYLLEEEGAPVPRTGGNYNLFYTGLSFLIGGLLLLFCTKNPFYQFLTKAPLLSKNLPK